jgi:hypothetical protein
MNMQLKYLQFLKIKTKRANLKYKTSIYLICINLLGCGLAYISAQNKKGIELKGSGEDFNYKIIGVCAR